MTAYVDRPSWKARLLAGDADAGVAAALGRRLGGFHATTARRPDLARRFEARSVFAAMRIEPYFGAVARVHPDLATPVTVVRRQLERTGRAVIHGDVSPKNVLCGPEGPMLVDAECATWGDPAFDLALCSAHLLLKCRWRPDRAEAYLACFDGFVGAYLAAVDWEDAAALGGRARASALCASWRRVDGMSPVEYLDDHSRAATRGVSRALVGRCPGSLAAVRDEWTGALDVTG